MREEDGHGEEAAAAVAGGIVDAEPLAGGVFDGGHAVVLGERGVHEGVLAVEQIEGGAVVLDEVGEEADGLFEHGLAEIVVEGGEALAVDGVVLFKAAEAEPVAGEFGGEAGGAGVLEQAAGLGGEDAGLAELAGGGEAEELVVGQAGPEEEAEAAGKGGVGEG